MNQITEIKTQIADLQDEMQLSKTLQETGMQDELRQPRV